MPDLEIDSDLIKEAEKDAEKSDQITSSAKGAAKEPIDNIDGIEIISSRKEIFDEDGIEKEPDQEVVDTQVDLSEPM